MFGQMGEGGGAWEEEEYLRLEENQAKQSSSSGQPGRGRAFQELTHWGPI